MESRHSDNVIEVASSFVALGSPFRHHFFPNNLCDNGYTTLDSCMEIGLNEDGFDCSGLVIASVCRTIGVLTLAWNRDYRHLSQLRNLRKNIPAKPGDALVFRYYDHIGIKSSDRSFIHASGQSKRVEESLLKGSYRDFDVIPLMQLIVQVKGI